MSNRDQIEAIKESLDIVSVIQGYVPDLKKSGRNYFGRCPFHKEKTPSFSVNPELRLFKCFGCQEGGDVIKFLEKIEGLDFPKALELAAQKAGIILKKTYSPEDDELKKQKDRLLEANLLTAKYYNYLLLEHKIGLPGKEYAKRRKLNEKELKEFLIGYAPIGYENLKNFLLKRGFNLSELVSWGLLVSKNGRVYDKFRGRLMFSIFDHQGDIVGFSGRLISDESMGPKYLNSPETLVYKKSKILYGLFQAKDSIRKNGFVVLVEGNVDILSSHGAGVPNIVAPLGTALTIDQVKLMKRYADSIYFALDTDSAGQKALEKDLPLLEEQGIKAYILDLGDYKDVDELIVKGGDWEKVLEKPNEVVPYFITSLKNKYDLDKAFERSEYIRKILGFISKTADPLLKNDYLQRLQDSAGIDMSVLRNELVKMDKNDKGTGKEQGEIIKEKQEKYVLTKYLLALIMEHKQYKQQIKKELLGYDYWVDKRYGSVYKAIWEANLASTFNLDEQELFEEVSLMIVPVIEDEEKFIRELRQVLQRIKKEKIKEELDAFRFIKLEDKTGVTLNRIQELAKELSKLDLVQ